MLQNKYSFNQSSVELEIQGLPDLSADNNEKSISIISSWKLSILNQPEIEGDINHLKKIVGAFYTYSAQILLDRKDNLETKLINISFDSDGYHNLLLKSTKSDVKPMNLKIGNA